jgi:hypothetical protein
MTPKQKAKDLIKKFTIIADDSNGIYYMDIATKEKALIAVNEIIDSSPMYYTGFEFESNLEYWQHVKTEIKKL